MSTRTAPAGPLADDAARAPSRAPWVLAVLGAALVALLGGLLLGRGTVPDPRVTDAASVGFLRDMTEHHAQAVRMSEVVHRRAEDPAVSYLAFDIMTTQQGQIGMMTGWLDLSDVPATATGSRMAWTGTPHEGLMPGMASEQDVAALETMPVPEMETAFLALMREHHVGGVDMAEAGVRLAEAPPVARLAAGMASGQQAEIELMDRMLTERGVALPAEDAAHGSGHEAAEPATGHDGH